MFGQNEIRKYDDDAEQLQVRDIWYTLQGEGPFAGRPAVFCRLTGCNLRCTFCDTEWDDALDKKYPVADVADTIIAECLNNKTDLVVLTGGEPARQNLSRLLALLHSAGLRVQLETAGTLWQDCFSMPHVTLVVSPKTGKIHDQVHSHAAAFKYVIRAGTDDPADGLPLASTQLAHGATRIARPRPGAEVYLSPCDEYDADKNAANRAAVARLALKHGYIAGLQLHKEFGVA